MDIPFNCAECGQSIVIDEAGAGITIDCPKCGSPVYVPSSVPPTKGSAPVRIEASSAKHMPAATPISRVPSRPVGLTMPQKGGDIHPAIVASLRCLIIGAVLLFAEFVALHQYIILAPLLLYAASPFLAAALLCAVYAMCIGHVNQGLLLVGGVSLILGLFFWIAVRAAFLPVADMQRQMEQMLRQLPQFPH